jgi:hypothetical protein
MGERINSTPQSATMASTVKVAVAMTLLDQVDRRALSRRANRDCSGRPEPRQWRDQSMVDEVRSKASTLGASRSDDAE